MVVIKILVILVPLLISIAYLTLAERKVLGYIQCRKGPNVVGLYGLLLPIADGLNCGGKGRHARFKIWQWRPYEFKSHQWYKRYIAYHFIQGTTKSAAPYKHKVVHYKYDVPVEMFVLVLKMDSDHYLLLIQQI